MGKMKLQGSNVKKLSKSERRRKELTLKRMEETRKEDTIQLRQEVKQKLQYYIEEYQKNSKLEQELRNELKVAQDNKLKLVGAISALKLVLGEK